MSRTRDNWDIRAGAIVMALAVLFALPAAAEEGLHATREEILAVSRSIAQEVPNPEPEPLPPADPADDPLYRGWFRIEGGPGASFGSDAQTTITPVARVVAETPFPLFNLGIKDAPRAYFRVQFAKQPGEPVTEAAGPESLLAYNTLDFRAGVKKRLFAPMPSGDQTVTLSVVGHGGYATRITGDPEARDKGPSYWGFGLCIDVLPAGHYFQVTVGPDQRLAGEYRPVIEVNAGLMLVDKGNFTSLLLVEALLDVDVSYYFESLIPARRNSYTASVVARWDTKKS